MELEYREIKESMNMEYNLDRIIDDFILICFFIGNDFLPRLYCYNVREGNFEFLINDFKKYLRNAKGYVNINGVIWVFLVLENRLG